MVWKVDAPQGNEASKIKWEIVPYTRGMGLDLGCGPFKAFPHFLGVDNCHHEAYGYSIKPDVKVDSCERLAMFASQSMDFIFSSHLLEHIEDYKSALKEWWRLIKVGGHLILYLPHKDFYPNIGQRGANPDHKHDFVPKNIVDAMLTLAPGFDLLERQERNQDEEYSMFLVFRKMAGMKSIFSCDVPRPGKRCAVVRYGAFGDLLQASSVLAGLKDQGYNITLYTSPPGSDVITFDPNVDQIILQQKDQVPNGDLCEFWAYLAKKYDKFVNLSESVEGTWLAMPGRAQHSWPHDLRHKVMNKNYLEFQHELAGVPHKPRVRFYALEAERKWAKQQRSKMGPYTVLWSLAGSAVHKTWPYLDNVVANLMLKTDAHVVLVGGPECKILESGWENEPRVHRTCGVWTIRQTMSFIDESDLIIGPETGVLNAACCLPMPKIITLSHSSHENLTRDWVNTTALAPDNVACYPCHMMHYNWNHCKKHEESGTAMCQAMIPGEKVWEAIAGYYVRHQQEAA